MSDAANSRRVKADFFFFLRERRREDSGLIAFIEVNEGHGTISKCREKEEEDERKEEANCISA